MMVLHSFNVQTTGGPKRSGFLGAGDMERLKKLFPDAPVWEGYAGARGNIRQITVEQARALYGAMTEYYAQHEVSDEKHQTITDGAFPVVSDLRLLFDELIGFFEREFHFVCSVEVRGAIVAKQQEEKARKEQARKKNRELIQTCFTQLGTLKSPADATIRAALEAKLVEYRGRLGQYTQRFPPDIAFRIQEGYRDAIYKILIAEAVLQATDEVSLLELAMSQLEKYGDLFDAKEFFNACGVIAMYYLKVEFPPPMDKTEATVA